MSSRRSAALVAATIGALAVTAAPALAREYRVDDNQAECPTAQFITVQAAVNASGPNDTVKVCPGTYPEQVRIDGPGHDGL